MLKNRTIRLEEEPDGVLVWRCTACAWRMPFQNNDAPVADADVLKQFAEHDCQLHPPVPNA